MFWNLITWKNLPSLIPSSLWAVSPGRAEMERFICFHFLCGCHMSIPGISQPIEAVPVLGTPVPSGFLKAVLWQPHCVLAWWVCVLPVTLNLTPRCVLKSEEATSLYWWVLCAPQLLALELTALCSLLIPCQRHFHCVTHLLSLKYWSWRDGLP